LVNVGKKIVRYNVGLKVDASREILAVVMTSYYKNFRSCKKTHSSLSHVLLFLGLATHYCES